MLDVQQPIIGAINGDAVGLGATIALACDIVVANETARFADTHVKNLGVAAGDGGTVLWPMMMGIHKAKEYLLTGDFLVASDAAKAGMINYAVPAAEVLPKAREIALKLAYGPVWAIRWTKTAMNKILREQLNLTLDTARFAEQICFASEDHQEAVKAFRQKRQPEYTPLSEYVLR
jgi:enoyl-CoA hydratase/carnithine racemase